MQRDLSNAKAPSVRLKLSWRKKLLFALVTVVAFVLLAEATLWLVGVRPVLYDKDPYVGFSGSVPLYEEQTVNGVAVLRTAHHKLEFFHEQTFPRDKPAGTFRIFSVGESTTHGQPFGDNVSFTGWLREFLPAADPSRQWEVINAGGISYASYRVALLMEELIRYQPDLFIVYVGQNEFLEQRTYGSIKEIPALVRSAGGLASRSRLYAVMQRTLDAWRKPPAADHQLGDRVVTMLDHSVGPTAYERDDRQRQVIVEHYRYNMARMVDIARSTGAEIVFVTPATNIGDCTPFRSQHRAGLTADQQHQFRHMLEQAVSLATAGKTDAALAAVDQALQWDDRYAEAHYRRGKLLQSLKRFDEAKTALERAREEDVCPLRAIAPIRAAVQQVAQDRQAALVDYATWVEQQSPHGIPGENLFVDHVHPTIEGHRRLALLLVDAMRSQGWVQPAANGNEAAIQSITTRVEASLDRRAHGIALRNLAKVLEWAGKFQDAQRVALQAIQQAPDDSEAYFVAGTCAKTLGRADEAIGYYRQSLQRGPQSKFAALTHLNLALLLEGKRELADAEKHNRAAIEQGLPSDVPLARVQLGRVLREQGQEQLAVDEFLAAIKLQPDLAEAHMQLGITYAQQGRPKQALEYLQTAARLAPDHANTLINLGVGLIGMNRIDESIVALEQAHKLDPGAAAPYDHLTRLYLTRRQPAEVERLLGNQVGAASLSAAQHLAWVSATSRDPRLHHPPRAVRWAEAITQITQRQSAAALDILAASYAAAGRFDDAVEQAKEAGRIANERGDAKLAARIKGRQSVYEQRQRYAE